VAENLDERKNRKRHGVLFLNAGLIHRIGPSRIYVKLSRVLAGMGFVSFRYDFSGIGDSGPREDKLPAEESIPDEICQAMDYLQESRDIRQFILVGMCSGASVSFKAATDDGDDRIRAAVLVNPLMPRTARSERMLSASYHWQHSVFNPKSWIKFICVKSNYTDLWAALSYSISRKLFPGLRKKVVSNEVEAKLADAFKSLMERRVHLLLMFSEGEIGDQYLKEIIGKEYNSMQSSGRLHSVSLLGSDHNVTPLASQEKLIHVVSEWLAGRCE